MPKHVLVALPLSDAQRSALQASVPEYEFIFAQTETVTLAQVLEQISSWAMCRWS